MHVTHLYKLDSLSGVEHVQAGEVSWLLYDGVVSVQWTRDCVRSTRVMTRHIATWKTFETRAHVMGVGDTKIMVKPGSGNKK